MQKENGYFPYLDGIPMLYAFFAWILFVVLLTLGDIKLFDSASIVCLPISFGVYVFSLTEKIKKKNNEIRNKSSVYVALFLFILLFSIDSVSESIFGITNKNLKIEFKVFVSGWVFLGLSLGNLYAYKSMIHNKTN